MNSIGSEWTASRLVGSALSGIGMRLRSGARWFWIVLAVALVVVLGLFIGFQRFDRRLADTERAFRAGQWKRVLELGRSYLETDPANTRVRLLVAEAIARDRTSTSSDQVREALGHLKLIPDDAKEAVEARLIEGRLYLLMLRQPIKAEDSFRRALQGKPQRTEAHTMLWKLYDLTDRWDLAEDHVWWIYEQTSREQRTSPLRDWYLSEFGANAANMELDRYLGFLEPGGQPGIETERRRLEGFVAADPESPEAHAVLARWYHRQRLQRPALELIDAAERLPGAERVAMLTGLRVAISLELGDVDQAKKVLESWAGPREGYEYWKAAGLVADQIDQNNELASEQYAKAIDTTAGKADWRTQHRLAQCLTRLGRMEEAERVRNHAKEVSSLMEPAVHQGLRRSLFNPLDPQTVGQMVEFYEKLGRSREVAAWKEVGGLSGKPAAGPATGREGGTLPAGSTN